jgi:GMP synthase (glutamine-hydrolysing)
VFEEEALKLEGVRWLAQGTICSDVIESAGTSKGKAHVIRSHQNLGGLPEQMKLGIAVPPPTAVIQYSGSGTSSAGGIDP